MSFCWLCWLGLPVGGLLLSVGLIALRFKLRQPKPRSPTHFKTTYGDWALVTGASSGIGAEMARFLAQEAVNVVLVARRKEVLDGMAAEFNTKYGVQTRVVAADLSTKEGPYQVHKEVADLDIGFLVNNAGVGWFGTVRNEEPQHIEQLIQLNCTSVAVLTRLFLERMHKRPKRSGILITSSLGSYVVIPYASVYTSAKAFASNFGIGVWKEELEAADQKVDISVLEPGPVNTGFREAASVPQEHQTSSSMSANPRDVADIALNSMAAKQPYCLPFFTDYAVSFLSALLPRPVACRIGAARYRKYAK